MLKILVFEKKFTKTNDWSVSIQVDIYPYIIPEIKEMLL